MSADMPLAMLSPAAGDALSGCSLNAASGVNQEA
jgi:hypothetical protein